MTGVYLIHFEKPYKHARHYIGYADDIDARIERHRKGNGARLLQVLKYEGICWKVVRMWEGGRDLERLIKSRRNARLLCPDCNPGRSERLAKYAS